MEERNLKIFQMNECDWWADFSKEEAVKNYDKFVMENHEYYKNDYPLEVTQKAMQTLLYYDEDLSKRTFQEELEKNIKEGQTKPFFFASTEY